MIWIIVIFLVNKEGGITGNDSDLLQGFFPQVEVSPAKTNEDKYWNTRTENRIISSSEITYN